MFFWLVVYLPLILSEKYEFVNGKDYPIYYSLVLSREWMGMGEWDDYY